MKRIFPLLILFCFIAFHFGALAVEPTVQAYNIAFSNVGKTQLRIAFTRGNGTYRIVVAKQTSDVGTVSVPTDGSSYTANAAFGSGSDLGTGTYVVYSGTGRALTVTGLSTGLPYAFQVFEFNGTGTGTDYLTSSAANNPRYTYTKPEEPSNPTATDITDVSFMANWDQPSQGNWDGYELEVATDSSFTNLLTDYNPAELGIDLDPNPHFLVEDLSANTDYYWRVRSRVEFRFSDWVTASVVTTAPAAPTVSGLTICAGSTATIRPTAPDTTAHTFRFYSASSGGTPLDSGLSYTTGVLNTTTTYYVSSVNTRTGVESSTRTAVTVTVQALPAPSLTGSTTVCANSTGSVYSVTNHAGNNYLWTVTGGSITAGDSTNSITITWGSAGTAQIIIAESTSAGCAGYDTLSVTVQSAPSPVISGQSEVCAFEQGSTFSVPDTSGTISWSITGGSIVDGQGTRLITVNWSGADSGKVAVTVTSSAGCTGLDTFDVAIQPLPTPAVTGTGSVCANEDSLVYSIGTTSNTIEWTILGGTIISGQGTTSLTINWDDTTSTGRVIATETTTLGCSGSDTMNITVFPVPGTSIEGNSNVCAFDANSVYHTINDTTGNSYSWSVTGGTITSGQGTSSIHVTWDSAGTGSVSLTETTPHGCTVSPSMTVTINPLPTPEISGSFNVCENSSTTFDVTGQAGNTYLWDITGGTISGSDSSSSVTIDWGSAGAAVITITETDSLGCSATVNHSVTVYATPSPVITGTLQSCTGNSLVYSTPSVNDNSYVWIVQGGTITSGDSTNSITVNWTDAGTNTIYVTETNPAGCSTRVSLDIEVQATPTPDISGSTSACANTLTGYSTELNTPNTYTWAVTGGTIISGASSDSVTVRWGASGTGRLIVTETSSFGCSASDTVSVTVNAIPAPDITGVMNVCANETNIPFKTAFNSGSTYSWTVTGGTIATGSGTDSITINWGAAGTGTIIVTETNGNGCSTSDTATVNIRPLPTPSVSGTQHVCEGSVVTYTTANNAGSTYVWQVQYGTVTSGQNTNSVTVTWDAISDTATVNATVSVTETLPTGCSATNNYNVLVHPNPEPAISGSATICANTAGSQYSVPFTMGHTYNWAVTGGTIASGSGTGTITVNWGGAGSGRITVSESTTTGCIGYDTLNVTIQPIPTPNITGNANVCANDTSVVFSTSSTSNTFAWTVTGATILGSTGSNTVRLNFGSAGTATLVVTETSSAGCSASDTFNITINALPAPSITGNTTVCANAANIQYSTTANAGSTYAWTVTGGTIASGAGTSSIRINWGGGTSGTIALTETNASGCTASASASVTIQAYPTPTITGPGSVIEDSTYTYSTTNNANNTYTWNVTGGTVNSGQNTNSVSVTWGSAGSGSISVTETSSGGCSTTANVSVTIRRANEPVKLVITTDIGRQVSGTPFNVTVQAQTQNGTPANVTSNTPISISVSTGSGSVSGNGTITAGSSQTTISVTYTNSSGESGVVLKADDGPGGLDAGYSNSFTVLAQEPSQASNIVWDSFDTTSISLSWTNGGGTGRLVIAKQTNSFNSNDNPSDGVGYTANSVFGSGSQIGGSYVVYNGTGSSVTVTGLTRNTRYWFKVFEYKGSGTDSTINYNLNSATGNPRSRFTAPRMPVVDDQFPTVSSGGLIYLSNFMPNPAKDKINFNIQLGEAQYVTVTIMNLAGQTIGTPINGSFYEAGTIHNISIPVTNIAAGTYIISVMAGDEMVMDKIVILP